VSIFGKIARLRVFDFDSEPARLIAQFGSERANVTPLTVPEGEAHVVCIRLGTAGVLGRHAGRIDQLFVVVQGEGWASGAGGDRVPISAGSAVYWAAGEEHETGSDNGLTAIVVESERIAVRG
jgi:mannose-6-phosphate isomerase-like protein (cupin superfamily)